MTRKKGHVARKKKGQTKDTNLCAAKAASDDAVANGDPNPTPMGRPWPTQEAAAALSPPTAPLQGSEKRALC